MHPRVPLAGREREVATLTGLAQRPLPQVALLGAEAGVGKTRLAHAVAERWPGTVLIGSASPMSAQPFGVLRDAVAQHASVLEGRDVPASLTRAVRVILGTPSDEAHAVGPSSREALLRGGVELLGALATEHPSLLVLDDMHWTDAESAELVSRLVRTAHVPVVAVLTYRPSEANASLRTLLADLQGRLMVTTMELGGLALRHTRDLVRALTGRPPADRLVRELHERTGGNPLFLEELSAAAGYDHARLRNQELPASVAETVAVRLQECDPVTARVAEGVAVLEQAHFELLTTVSEVREQQLLAALRALRDMGWLVEMSADVFAYRHELLRAAVAGRLLARERRRLHDIAYRALLDAESDDATLAHHAAMAGRGEDMAGHAEAGAALRLRQGFNREALRLAEWGLQRRDTLRLRAVSALASRNLSLYDEAAGHAVAWHDLARESRQLADRVEALLLLAEVKWAGGDTRAAQDHLAASVDLARDEPVSRARAQAEAARFALLAERPIEAVRHADEALVIAAEHALDRVTAATRVTKGTALLQLTGREDEGYALIEAGGQRALAAGDVFTAGRAALNALTVGLEAQPAESAWSAFEEARAFIVRHELDAVGGNLTRIGVDLAVAHGDLPRALALALDRLNEEIDPLETAALAAKAGVLLLERGDDATARGLLDRHLPQLDRLQVHWVRTYLGLLDVASAARQPGAARTASALHGYRDVVTPAAHGLRAPRAAEAARWALGAGVAVDEVRRFLDDVLACAPDPPGAWWRVQLDIALADAEGDVSAVAKLSSRPFSGGGQPHLEADAHHRVARAALATGPGAIAEPHLRRARELLRDWPGWRRDAVDDTLARLEKRDFSAQLTGRETEVMGLVAQGRSNAQIARTLGISPKTVAVHVSRILKKTGCRSRTEVAAMAAASNPTRHESWME